MNKTKSLKFGLLNPGSLGTKHEEFVAAMMDHDVDILAINETWLREGEEGRAPSVAGYKFIHTPRPPAIRARGGGVGFFIRKGIHFRILPHPESQLVEQMWLSASFNGKSLLIGTAYRPPWLSLQFFIDGLTDTLSSFEWHNHTVLLGDLNVDLLNKYHSSTKTLLDFLALMKLTQYIDKPTHFTDHSETLLDLICTDASISHIRVSHIPELSSHSFVSCQLNTFKNDKALQFVVYRPIKDINLNDFRDDLMAVDWSAIQQLSNVNDMTAQFMSCIVNLFDMHAPLKRMRIRDKHHHPWVTYNVRLMMRTRNEAQVRARKSGLDTHKDYYKQLKNIVVSALHTEKQAYFRHYVNSNVHKPQVMWKHLKRHLAIKTKNDMPIPAHLCDPNLLNDHFLNVPGRNTAPLSNLTYFEFQRYCSETFDFSEVTETQVSKIIKTLTSNATGADGVNLDMLLLTLPNSLETLTKIINTSFKTNLFPDMWQHALVKPIPKKSNPSEPKDLRPISILPNTSKILEKIACDQLKHFLEVKNILPVTQSGFRPKRSTATALMAVVDDMLTAQDMGEGTILVLLDYTRAFDCINIPLLLSKMSYYGFSVDAVAWFDSYFRSRSQSVVLEQATNDKKSGSRSIRRGIAQGSILGPLLFILYSADLVSHIQFCKYHMYADDLQLYLSFNPAETSGAIEKINSDLQRIYKWSEQNALVLNPDKSKYLIIGSKKQIQKTIAHNPTILINGTSIERVSEARNLGVLMDDSLRFEKHVINTARNCFYRLKVLYKIRNYISQDLRVKLCESLVLSKLNYADTVIGPRLLVRSQNLIQRVQNACARYCIAIPPRAHITPYLNDANLLKMKYRRELHFASLLFGIIVDKCPPYLYCKLRWRKDINTPHCTRLSSYKLVLPRYGSAAFHGSFKYNATRCWNNLPPPLRSLKSIKSFKKQYKLYLLIRQKTCN